MYTEIDKAHHALAFALLTMWWLVPIINLPIPFYFLASMWMIWVTKRITFDDLDLD